MLLEGDFACLHWYSEALSNTHNNIDAVRDEETAPDF